jgi:CBS domain-containing protein
MNAENILQTKGAEVFSITTDAQIVEAVAILAERKIGALIVMNADNKVAGILSERDIVRRLHQSSATVLHQTIASCMTANPICCGLDASIDEMMHTMTKNRIRHLPVVEAGALVGMISIGDVVKRKISATEEEAAALREYIAS